MARMLSPIASILRGSIAGLTFSANQWHQIIVRAKTSPVNPATTNQTHIRTAFSAAANEWNLITQTQRDLWDNYADTLVYEGPLGTYNVPGRQVFIGSFSFLKYINNRALDTIVIPSSAPGTPGFGKIDSITSDDPAVPSTGFDVNVSQSMGENMSVIVERSVGFNPSRERFKGPWVTADMKYIDLVSGVTAHTSFIELTEGNAYFFRVRGCTNDTEMLLAVPYIGRHIAATTVI